MMSPRDIEHSLQRKYTIIHGGAKDHQSTVSVKPLASFDLDNTIFTTLEGALPRLFMTAKIAKEPIWNADITEEIEVAYRTVKENLEIPEIPPALLKFMEEECDFSAEHADGSFMEHLVYGYEYGLRHYPDHSALVMLLHSIMGTATNTFAMEASKIPLLKPLLTDFEFLHISAFPSFLRLMYEPSFFEEIRRNKHRITELKGIRFHRVIDNESMTMDAENLWIQLNYHLMHFVDFLPVSNWRTHFSDPLLQMFMQLSDFLDEMNQRQATVVFDISVAPHSTQNEQLSFGSRLSNIVPTGLKQKLATKSIRKFSERIGHTLTFDLIWDA